MSDSKKAPAKKSGAKSAPYTAPEGSFWAKAWTLPAALAAEGLKNINKME